MTDCKTHYITKVVNVMKQHQKKMLNDYLEKLLNLKMNGNFNKDETIEVEGKIQLKNKDINVLTQFIMDNQE